VQAAGVRPFVVHRAAARLGIKKLAVAAGATRQAEDAVLEIEVLDQPGLGQALGDLLGVFVLGIKRVHQFQANQIGQLDLDRHGAAIGGTGVAQAVFVTGPGFATVNVNDGNGGSHGAIVGSQRRASAERAHRCSRQIEWGKPQNQQNLQQSKPLSLPIMKKSLLFSACLLAASLSVSAQELCTYTTKISAKDKLSSTGISLVNSNTRDTLVLLIQQDRANYFKFNRRDAEDREDCRFSSPEERAKIKLPSRSLKIEPELIQRLITQELVIRVTVLENGLEIVEATGVEPAVALKPAARAEIKASPEVKPPAPAPAAAPIPAPAPVATPQTRVEIQPEPKVSSAPIKTETPAPRVTANAPETNRLGKESTAMPQAVTRAAGNSEQKPSTTAARYSNEQGVLFYNVFSSHYLLAMSLDAASKSQCASEIKNYPTGGFAFNSRMNIIDFFNKQNQSNFGSQLVNEIVLNTQLEKIQFDTFFKTTDKCQMAVAKDEFAYELSNKNFGFKN
jgi:outer membrane biosynthesis protein TonB